MAFAKPISPLQRTISQIEQALDVLRPANERDIRLLLKIEEAVEMGYEAIYSRAQRASTVLVFPRVYAGQECTLAAKRKYPEGHMHPGVGHHGAVLGPFSAVCH
jgi:hypothetical protein